MNWRHKRTLWMTFGLTTMLLTAMLLTAGMVAGAESAPNIEGTVTFPNGEPAPGAMVYAFDFADGTIPAQVQADAEGNYALELPLGDYDLWAEPPTGAPTYTQSIPLFVEVDAETVYLPGNGDLTLTYPAFAGIVRKPDATPFGDCAWVWAENVEGGWETGHQEVCGFESRPYRIGGLDQGYYKVWAEPTDPFLGLAAGHTNIVSITEESQYLMGTTVFTDVMLMPGEPITPQLSVFVENPAGDPAFGVVHLWSDMTGEDRWAHASPDRPARFANLPSEAYKMQAWPIGADIPMWANSPQEPVWIDPPEMGTITRTLRLGLPDVVGIVKTPEDNPLPQAFDWDGKRMDYPVEMLFHDFDWSFTLWSMTNITGEFGLALPPEARDPGREFDLLAFPRGSLHELYTKSMPHPFPSDDFPPGGPYNAGVIRLTYPRIEGVVVQENAAGEWMPVTTGVELWSHDGGYWDWEETYVIAPGEIIPFRFGGIPDGMHSIQSNAPYDDPLAGLSNIYDFEVTAGSQYDISATEWVTLYIGGDYGANVVGTVVHPVEDTTGQVQMLPVPWAEVRIKWETGDPDWPFEEEWTQANGEGHFAFYGLITDTQYSLQAFPAWEMGPEWDPSHPFDFLFEGDLVTKTLTLRPAFRPKTVTGTVMYDDGAPVEDATVYAFNDENGAWVETWSDEEGAYELKLKGGLWWIGVEPYHGADWYFDPAWNIPVEFSRTAEIESAWVDLYVERFDDMEDFVEVTGRVETPAEDPAPDGTWAEICNDATGRCFGGETEQGNFSFWAPIGSYHLGIYPDPETGFLPPFHNGDIGVDVFEDPDTPGAPVDLGTYYLRKKVPALVTGRVIETGSGNGVRDVPIEAWTEDGDFAMTRTDASGYYTLTLSPGYWRGGPVLSGTLASKYVVLPPQRRDGLLTQEGAVDQDFRLSRLNATIQGTVVAAGTTDIITDVDATVFVETCNYEGCIGVDVDVYEGEFSVRVIGGYTYTVDIWAERYMAGPNVPAEVYVAAGETERVNLGLMEANTRIHGYLLDSESGDPVQIHAHVDGVAPAKAYNANAPEYAEFWVSDALWPEKDPYKFNLYVPTPDQDSEPVTWDLSLLVDPRHSYSDTHYIAAPGYSYDVTIAPGDTDKAQILYVKELDTFITGTLHMPNGDPAPYIPVFARPTTITDSEGLLFEAETGRDGRFKIPVLPGEAYEVGAFLPPKLKEQGFLPPLPKPWSNPDDNPIHLRFRKLDAGDLTISGRVTVTPTGALTVGVPIHVLGWAEGGAQSSIIVPLGSLYRLPVISNTTWHVWAAYEDTENNAFYHSREKVIEVQETSVLSQHFTLQRAFDLPDKSCWMVTSNGSILQFPRRSDLLPPVLWVKPGTFAETVEICAEPRAILPDGPRLIGFGYDLTARDSQGRELGEDDFKQTMRLSFYYTQEALNDLPIDPGYEAPEPNNLSPVYYSTIKNEWVPLDDPMVDEADMFVTGKMDHFTEFGLMSTTPAIGGESNMIYLPLVLKH
ncbi:MAG: carboxypeptidase-like regulatory domain-containing protein [Anaerolineales bacterium]